MLKMYLILNLNIYPGGGSDSPISWKKYPFLDIPEGGASAGERKTEKDSDHWGESGQQ